MRAAGAEVVGLEDTLVIWSAGYPGRAVKALVHADGRSGDRGGLSAGTGQKATDRRNSGQTPTSASLVITHV